MPDMDQMKNCATEPGRVTAEGWSPDSVFSWSMPVTEAYWHDPKNLMVVCTRFKASVADVIGPQYEHRLKFRYYNPLENEPGRVVIDYVP